MAVRLFLTLCLVIMSGCTTTLPVAATHLPITDLVGEACSHKLFGLIPLSSSDISIYKAASSAGIKRISVVDYRISNYLVFTSNCTLVRGHRK